MEIIQKQEWGEITRFLIVETTENGIASIKISIVNEDSRIHYGDLQAFVGDLWVDEAIRGKGHGTRLLQKAESIARDRGIDKVLAKLQWKWHPDEAIAFFDKHGYKLIFGPNEFRTIIMGKDFGKNGK